MEGKSILILNGEKPGDCECCFYRQICKEDSISTCPVIEIYTPWKYRNKQTKGKTEKVKPLKVKVKYAECTFCGKPNVYAKGLCKACYGRASRNGVPDYMPRKCKEPKPKPTRMEKLTKQIFGQPLDQAEVIPTIDKMLDEISQRESFVIRAHYMTGKTLQKIGEELCVSRERVRQIEARGIRRMRKYYTRAKHDAEIEMREEENNKTQWAYQDHQLLRDDDSIDFLRLNARANNCLKRNGLLTIRDIKEFVGEKDPVSSFMAFRNCGRKTAETITCELVNNGILHAQRI